MQGLAFEPDRFDVVVAPAPFAEPLFGVAAHARHPRVAASGRLARVGPGVFAPAHGSAEEIAGQGVANPAVDAARRGADARRRASESGARRRRSRARCSRRAATAPGRRTWSPRDRRDDARVRRRRHLGAALRDDERGVLPGGQSHEDARRRRDPALARGRGCRDGLRPPRRRDPADLRRVRARHDRPPRPRPARAGRRPHGRGLRAGDGARRRRASRRPGRARRTSSRRSPTPGWTRPRSSASPARCART